MSSSTLVSAAIILFCVAAILYYQNTTQKEHFTSPGEVNNFLNSWVSWAPTDPPIAGSSYTPNGIPNQNAPNDLSIAPISQPGAYPSGITSGKKQLGPTSGINPSLARSIDLMELDSKITTWLEAATQCENDAPCTLTPLQQQQRVLLQSRLVDVRSQIQTNQITDKLRDVTNEIMALREENAKWYHKTPFLSAVFEFGVGVDQEATLTKNQYNMFLSIVAKVIQEYEELNSPTPQQKVRTRQLHEILEYLLRLKTRPYIRMGATRLFLQKTLLPEQPLPTLYNYSYEDISDNQRYQNTINDHDDVMNYLKNIQWKLKLRSDPVGQELQRSATALLNGLKNGDIPVTDALNRAVGLDTMLQPAPAGAPDQPLQYNEQPGATYGNKRCLIAGAKRLCRDVTKAFPRDAAALGCAPIKTRYQAETVINTVCNNIRSSVPTVSPDQFNCGALKQQLKRDG